MDLSLLYSHRVQYLMQRASLRSRNYLLGLKRFPCPAHRCLAVLSQVNPTVWMKTNPSNISFPHPGWGRRRRSTTESSETPASTATHAACASRWRRTTWVAPHPELQAVFEKTMKLCTLKRMQVPLIIDILKKCSLHYTQQSNTSYSNIRYSQCTQGQSLRA